MEHNDFWDINKDGKVDAMDFAIIEDICEEESHRSAHTDSEGSGSCLGAMLVVAAAIAVLLKIIEWIA